MQLGSALAINLLKSFALSCVNTAPSFPRVFPRWDSFHPCHFCLCKPALGVSLHQRDRAKLLSSLPPLKNREITPKMAGLQKSHAWPWELEGWTPAWAELMGLCWLPASPGARFAEGHREPTSFQTAFGQPPLLPGSFSASLSTCLWPGPQILE